MEKENLLKKMADAIYPHVYSKKDGITKGEAGKELGDLVCTFDICTEKGRLPVKQEFVSILQENNVDLAQYAYKNYSEDQTITVSNWLNEEKNILFAAGDDIAVFLFYKEALESLKEELGSDYIIIGVLKNALLISLDTTLEKEQIASIREQYKYDNEYFSEKSYLYKDGKLGII